MNCAGGPFEIALQRCKDCSENNLLWLCFSPNTRKQIVPWTIFFFTVWHLHVFHFCLRGTCWNVLWPWVLQTMLGRVSHIWVKPAGDTNRPMMYQLNLLCFSLQTSFLPAMGVILLQVSKSKDSRGGSPQHLLPGLWLLPASACGSYWECGV